jgi:hypothetical protein
MSIAFFCTLLAAATTPLASAYAAGLELTYSDDQATQGIAISVPDNRVFLTQRYSTTLPPQVVELLADNVTTVLYPNAAWNSYNATNSSSDPRTTFVSIDGARIGPDGRYWLVDGGSAGINGSTKLVGVNITTNTVDKVYYLDDIKATDSGIDDVRFNAANTVAYLSDTAGALLVLNLTTGDGVRVLAGDQSASAYFPMAYNGTLVPDYQGDGGALSVGLDQIEVSLDGVYLYY